MKLLVKPRMVFLFGLFLAFLLGWAPLSLALDVGDKAPDFELPSTMGKKIKLSDYRGKKIVLLEFYSDILAPVWTANLSTRMADFKKFQKLNVQILGISGTNPFPQKTFAVSLNLPFPLLSDFPHLKTTKSYGGLSQGSDRIFAQRYFFLIDLKGIVQGKWRGTSKDVMPSEPILGAIKKMSGKP